MKMVNEIKPGQDELKKQIQEFAFAEHELTLFLDTHPRDKKALELHKAMAERLRELTAIYEEMFGPITSCGSQDAEKWTWIENPWPWDKQQEE